MLELQRHDRCYTTTHHCVLGVHDHMLEKHTILGQEEEQLYTAFPGPPHGHYGMHTPPHNKYINRVTKS